MFLRVKNLDPSRRFRLCAVDRGAAHPCRWAGRGGRHESNMQSTMQRPRWRLRSLRRGFRRAPRASPLAVAVGSVALVCRPREAPPRRPRRTQRATEVDGSGQHQMLSAAVSVRPRRARSCHKRGEGGPLRRHAVSVSVRDSFSSCSHSFFIRPRPRIQRILSDDRWTLSLQIELFQNQPPPTPTCYLGLRREP